MMKLLKSCSILTFGLLFQGCATVYKPETNEPTATVRVVGLGDTTFCKNGEYFNPPQVEGSPDTIGVPAGHRITLISHFASGSNIVMLHCSPALSFIPDDGRSYLLNAVILDSNKCSIELVRKDLMKKNGLSREDTVERSSCKKP